jgi:hypothetical protein
MSWGRGTERWLRSAWLLLLLLALAAPRAARAEAGRALREGDFMIGSGGRRFRVRFDPASRISIGIGSVFGRAANGAPTAAPEVSAGLSYRALYISGAGQEQVIWQVDHHVLSGMVMPLHPMMGGVPAADAAVYGVSALRHDEAPSVILPISPPVSIPFPFDVGFEGEVGRVYVPSVLPRSIAGKAKAPMLHLGVLRAALIFDLWRTGRPGRSLEIGIGARYEFDAYAEPTLKTPRMVHRVAPMTAASLRFRIQSGDGLAVFDCRAEVVPHWTSESIWKLSALSTLHLERTLIAVNDQPIALFLEGGYRTIPDSRETLPLHDVQARVGFSFNLALR